MNQVLPKLKVYIISWQKMLQFDDLFKRETGKDRRITNSWLSTGWFTMTIALELCDRINVYGMVPPDFCRESQHSSVPYHYYEPTGPDECAMYISHERGRRGSHHRFITEKRVFANWARTFNIHFYQPDWSPPPLPRNSTATAAFPRPQKTWLFYPEPSDDIKTALKGSLANPVAIWMVLYVLDRLWRTALGLHSWKTDAFILHIHRSFRHSISPYFRKSGGSVAMFSSTYF